MGALRAWTAVAVALMLLAVALVSSSSANQESTSAIKMARSLPGSAIDTPVEPLAEGRALQRSVAAWTIIVYLAGDNNLGTYMENDLSALTTASSNPDINILVLFDKSDYRDTRAYYLDGGARVDIPLNQIDPAWQSELNMGDPNTLVKFAAYCVADYPADHYLIVPQDHGGAWQGCCWDDSSGDDRLTLAELGAAFEVISGHIGKKVDVVLFNDCLMSNLDVLFQVQDSVSYVVASESIGWTNNWDDEWGAIIAWMKADPGRSGEDVAEYLVTAAQIVNDPDYVTQSVAAVNMTKLPELVDHLEALCSRSLSQMSIEGSNILDARASCISFEGPYIGQKDRLIDLYQFIQGLATYSDDATIDSLCADMMYIIGPSGGSSTSLVLKQRSTSSTSFSHGISVYFPSTSTEYEDDYVNGNDLASSTSWDEMFLAIRQYTPPDDAIWVNSDAELVNLVNLNRWGGRGTASDPYRVRGLYLVGVGNESCIYLGNLTKYVLVEDCSLRGLSLDAGRSLSTGISVFNCAHVRIEHNTITDCRAGVSLDHSLNARISNNTITGSSVAVSVTWSGGAIVCDNTMAGEVGVALSNTDMGRIERNTLTTGEGVVLTESSFTMLSANTMSGGGVEFNDITSARSASVSLSNTVNGLAIAILKDVDLSGQEISLTGGQVILANVTNGILAGVVQGGASTGICLIGCSQLDIVGCELSSDKVGIALRGCVDLILERNKIIDSLAAGLLVLESGSVIVRNNTFERNGGPGVSLTDSDGCIVTWNNFLGNNGTGGSFDPSRPQAYDSGDGNVWCWAGRGNHWSDMTGPDVDVDGLVDEVYPLSNAMSDLLPLTLPVFSNRIQINSEAELLNAVRTNGWSGTGSVGDPIIITGIELIVSGHDCPIYIGNVSLNIHLERPSIRSFGSGPTGISLYNVGNLDICDGSVSGFETAISMIDTGVIGITNMSFDGGVRISGDIGTWASFSVDPLTKVNGKDLVYLSDIDLGGSIIDQDAGQIILVNVTNAVLAGQSFSGASIAIQMAHCHQVTVQEIRSNGGLSAIFAQICSDIQVMGCTFSNGSGNGVQFEQCDGLRINGSAITGFSGYAARLHGCLNGLIFNNDLVNNHGSDAVHSSMLVQAFDDGQNDWNGSKRGNHWADWTAPDLDGDGLVDEAYHIDGGTSYDARPLVLSRTVDIEPPEVHIISPTPGALFTSSTFEMSWTVQDNESALSNVSVIVDGVHYLVALGSSTISMGPLSDGIHNISIVATDEDGNTASVGVDVTIDAHGPTVIFLSPLNGSAIPTVSPTVKWSSTDAGTFTASVMIKTDGGDWAVTSGGQSLITGLSDGWHEIWINATDGSGHITLAMLRFLVDTVLPDLRLDQFPNGMIGSENASIIWSAWDNQSGLVWAGVRVDNGPWATCHTPYSAIMSGLQDGMHNVTLAVRDAAGNVQSKAFSFQSDAHGPIINFVPDANGMAFSSSEVQISWSGQDIGSGVVRYDVSLGQGEWADIGMSTSFSFSDLEEGYYTVHIRATDVMGWSSIASSSFWVDMSSPQLTITPSGPTLFINSSSMTLLWEAETEGSPVEYSICVDGAAPSSVGSNTTIELTLTDGDHIVLLMARDGAGNEVSRSVRVMVDRTAPQCVQRGPEGDACSLSGPIFIMLDEPLGDCQMTLDGAILPTTFDGRFWNSTMQLSPGTCYKAAVTVRDLAGNIAVITWNFNSTSLVEFKGQIVDSNGLPIAGAKVAAGNYSCVTDVNGEFFLVAPYDVGMAEVTAEGRETFSIELTQADLGARTMNNHAPTSPWTIALLAMSVVALAALLLLLHKRRGK